MSNFILLAAIAGCLVWLICVPTTMPVFFLMVALALAFGFLLVIPIGAADMPVVIALLNSYAGLADAAMGFMLMNKIQIITGSLDGTSGFLLSLLMCRAMNRSAMNVLFGAFGKIEKEEQGPTAEAKGTVRSITPDELAVVFESARSVIVVPGYGMAVAQAQYAVSDLAKLLLKRGIEVKYAIHPVAGRMPGHMNVLLAEANVPYDQLYEMEQINRDRGERRHQPGGQEQQEQPALRHADSGSRPRQVDHRPQAQHAPRLCGRGQRAVLQPEMYDALWRCEGKPEQAICSTEMNRGCFGKPTRSASKAALAGTAGRGMDRFVEWSQESGTKNSS
jgi:hypothetical protein